MDDGKLLEKHEYQTKETGLACGDWESYSDKQVLHKAGANNSGICRVSLKVGRSISWPLANAGANGYK